MQRARKTTRCVICPYPQSTLLFGFGTAHRSLHGVIFSQETAWCHRAEAASLEISQYSWLKTCCHCLTMRCMNRSLMAISHLKHAMEHYRIRNRYLQYRCNCFTVDRVRTASNLTWNFPRHNIAIFSTSGNDWWRITRVSNHLRYSRFHETTTPPLFYPNFRGVPFGLDCRCCGSEERRP